MKKTPDKRYQVGILAKDYTHYSRWMKRMGLNLQEFYFISNINVVKFIFDYQPNVWILPGSEDKLDFEEIVDHLQSIKSIITFDLDESNLPILEV
jgi:hypothetical protein